MLDRPLLLSLLLAACLAGTLHADTTIVDDDFESYADDNALYGAWEPRDGSGAGTPTNPDDSILTIDDTLFPGIEGQAVDYIGEFGGSIVQSTVLTPSTTIFPTETQNIHLQGDIYVGNDGNSRTSIGLRNRTAVSNIIELGTYNSNDQTTDPTSPDDTTGVVPVTTYAYRLVLMDGRGESLFRNPNWQFFQFDTALDIDDTDPRTEEPTPDGIVGPIDIGAGWHTYSATITETTVTVEMDLYRDGLDNGATITAGTDVPGVDASITWEVQSDLTGFDSLRLGGPSGISSANGVAFDNLSLTLVDVVTGGDSDADGDGDIDGNDFLILQRDNPAGIPQWELDYPFNPALSAAAVPEPGSIAIAVLAGLGLLASRQR